MVGYVGKGCTISRVCFSGLIGLSSPIGPKFRSFRLTEPNNQNNRNKFGLLRAGTEQITEFLGLGLFGLVLRFGLNMPTPIG